MTKHAFELGDRVRVGAEVKTHYQNHGPFLEEDGWQLRVSAPPGQVWNQKGLYRRILAEPHEGMIIGYTHRMVGLRCDVGEPGYPDTKLKVALAVKVWIVARRLRWQPPYECLEEDIVKEA